MTAPARILLTPAVRAQAVRHLERRTVDAVALLVAIHDAPDTKALADARLAAIFALDAVGGYVWPDGCPVVRGSDALALGCLTGVDAAGRVVHALHGPLTFPERISRVTARAESRLDGTDSTSTREMA